MRDAPGLKSNNMRCTISTFGIYASMLFDQNVYSNNMEVSLLQRVRRY